MDHGMEVEEIFAGEEESSFAGEGTSFDVEAGDFPLETLFTPFPNRQQPRPVRTIAVHSFFIVVHRGVFLGVECCHRVFPSKPREYEQCSILLTEKPLREV